MSLRRGGFIGGIMIALLASGEARSADERSADLEGFSRSAESAFERLFRTIEKLESYSDEGAAEFKTPFGFGGLNEQKVPFSYKKPDRFRIQNMMYDIVSDGKELNVYMKNNRRYVTEPLRADVLSQLKSYGLGAWVNFSVAELVLSKDPKAYVAERFKEMNVTGEETVDDDKCLVVEGVMKNVGAMSDAADAPAKLFLREKDGMVRKYEIKMSPGGGDDDEENSDDGFTRTARQVTIVYHARELRVNGETPSERFTFKPPAGAKKVEQFFSSWFHTGDSAQAFELSGKPAPDFELETTGGGHVALGSLKGKVAVLDFRPPSFGGFRRRSRGAGGGGGGGGGFATATHLDQIRREFADQGVAIVCIEPSADASGLVEHLKENNQSLTVALDPDRTASGKYFDQAWNTGVVLIGKDGVVQGKYPSLMTEDHAKSLRKDIEKLLKGEVLAGGRPLSEEQLEELVDQRGGFFGGDVADPLNEDRLEEAWSVRAAGERQFGFGGAGGGASRAALWIRSKDVMQEIDPSGKIIAEIPIPGARNDDFAQEQVLIGRLGGRGGVVYMTTIASDEATPFGWRPPKTAILIGGDESGNERWKMELEIKNQQAPQHLALGDLDGRGGDELVFVHQGSLWIVDDRGEVAVRKPLPNWVSWVRVEDLDKDKRAEVYVRDQNRLHRYDYAGKR